MKKDKGAVTMVIFIAMLIFSLYGMIFYGNSVSAFIRQEEMIKAIQKVYSKDVNNAYQIAASLED